MKSAYCVVCGLAVEGRVGGGDDLPQYYAYSQLSSSALHKCTFLCSLDFRIVGGILSP